MLTADKTTTLNGVKVSEYLLTKHNPNKISMPTVKMTKPIGITVHNTDDLKNVNDDAEQYTRATYNGNMKSVRVHFYVDDLGAWQNLPLDLSSWHAGDGANGTGNAKTISIECIMNDVDKEHDKKAEDNCARLVAYLLNKYDLKISDVYTHNHWMGLKDEIVKGASKNCPIYILPHWSTFLKTVENYVNAIKNPVTESVKPAPTTPTPAPTPVPTTTAITKGTLVSIAKGAKYYNGASVPSWVYNQNWYVSSISGDRAVIDKNEKGNNAICSPISTKYLTVVKAGQTTTTTSKPTTTTSTTTFKKGDAIKLSSSAKYTTGKSVPLWVRALTCYVLSVNKDGSIVFSIKKNGAVTGAVPAKYVTKK